MIEYIKASDVLGYNRAKWSKEQPHKEYGIYWTNKLSTGVEGCNKEYWAISFEKKVAIPLAQLHNGTKGIVWQAGKHKPAFDTLTEAKEYVKGMILND
jgi:hypothetical protein